MTDNHGAFLGSGKLYIADYDTPNNLKFIGNVSGLQYQPEANDLELADYTTPGGGLDASVRRVQTVNITFDGRHLNKGNVQRAIFGTTTDVAPGQATGEAHTVSPGSLVVLEHPGGTGHVVKAGVDTLAAGTDYVVTAAGNIQLLEGGEIVTETEIEVDYDYGGYAKIEGLTATGARFRLYFEGVNEVNGKPATIDVYKVGFSPSTLDMIGDDFASMPFEGRCEKDDRKSYGAGISQFMSVKL